MLTSKAQRSLRISTRIEPIFGTETRLRLLLCAGSVAGVCPRPWESPTPFLGI